MNRQREEAEASASALTLQPPRVQLTSRHIGWLPVRLASLNPACPTDAGGSDIPGLLALPSPALCNQETVGIASRFL